MIHESANIKLLIIFDLFRVPDFHQIFHEFWETFWLPKVIKMEPLARLGLAEADCDTSRATLEQPQEKKKAAPRKWKKNTEPRFWIKRRQTHAYKQKYYQEIPIVSQLRFRRHYSNRNNALNIGYTNGATPLAINVFETSELLFVHLAFVDHRPYFCVYLLIYQSSESSRSSRASVPHIRLVVP